MDDGDVILQIGLLLTQLRYTRRALEDIERSTARYTSFGFATLLSAGPAFGAPPMLAGALKVHVVNINDLTAGSGSGGFLEGLLGGVGRFFGGLFGGFVGGTVGGVLMPKMIGDIAKIVSSVDRIMQHLESPPSADGTGTPAAGTGGSNLIQTLDKIKEVATIFSALFSSPKPETATGAEPQTPAAKQWLTNLQTADALVRSVTLVVKGLTILIPEIIGALALLIVRLDSIKLAIVEMLQFILREALLLRGYLVTVLFDTGSAAATLAANIVGIIGVTIESAVASVFKILGSAFDAALAAIEFISNGLQRTIDALLKWLVESLVTALNVIGDTRLVRIAVYAFQVIPYVLPSLLQLKGLTISSTDQLALDKAKTLDIAKPASPGATATAMPSFSSISAALLEPTAVGTLRSTIDKSMTGAATILRDLFGDSEKGLRNIASRLDRAAGGDAFNVALDKHMATLKEKSASLAGTLEASQKQAADAVKNRPDTGLEKIAKAYEAWLSSPGGLNAVLGNIQEFIKQSPDGALAKQAVGPSDSSQVTRATVEIQNVVIELDAPAAARTHASAADDTWQWDPDPDDHFNHLERQHELAERGYTFMPGAMFVQA